MTPTLITPADRAAFVPTTVEPKLGSLVEAPVIGTPGTFRVTDLDGLADGEVWIRETGLHLGGAPEGYEPFVISWPVAELRVVAQ